MSPGELAFGGLVVERDHAIGGQQQRVRQPGQDLGYGLRVVWGRFACLLGQTDLIRHVRGAA